jgi:hypothetical protein
MALARMRTIKQCYDYFQAKDPESSISEYYLRCLVKQNKIPVFLSGRKQLVNIDTLIDYLNTEMVQNDMKPQKGGKIRPITE